MKHILITGSKGQLGTSLQNPAKRNNQFSFSFIDINELDLTNTTKVRQFFNQTNVNYIINCAAYTAVDRAETQSDEAFAVNYKVPSLLGKIALEKSIRLLHISTDYIYDGNCSLPHREEEIPSPVSVYARSKLEGERALWNNPFAAVIRTSWLYSEFGTNFMKTIIRLSKEKPEVGVVFDQVGTPTYAGDLAESLIQIIAYSEANVFMPGIYNYSNEGVCSWYDFAVEIINLTKSNCNIKPIKTDQYPLPAQRLAYSVLDKTKIKNTFRLKIPYWKESLIIALENLNSSIRYRTQD